MRRTSPHEGTAGRRIPRPGPGGSLSSHEERTDAMLRRMLVLLIAATTVVAPVATPEAAADPVVDGIPECPDPVVDPDTGEEYYPPTDDTVCASDDTEDPFRPRYRVCSNDEVLFGEGGGQLLCLRTHNWSYLPGPGVCAYVFELRDPIACYNGPSSHSPGCLLIIGPVHIICE